MKNSQKSFAPIALIIILVILAGGGYFLLSQKSKVESPKQEAKEEQNVAVGNGNQIAEVDTKDWKTFTDVKQGYSFQYPEKLSLTTDGEYVRLFRKVPYDFDLYIRIDSNKVNMPKNDWTYSTGSLNSKFDTTGSDVLSGTIYYLPIVGNRTLIITKHDLSNTKESEEMLNKVLSTFKFTEPAAKVDISNWKTYRNEKYGFEFRYPSSWIEDISSDTYQRFFTRKPKEGVYECGENIAVTIVFMSNPSHADASKWFSLNPSRYQYHSIPVTFNNTTFYDSDESTDEMCGWSSKSFVTITPDVSVNVVIPNTLQNFLDIKQVLSTFKFTPSQISPK